MSGLTLVVPPPMLSSPLSPLEPINYGAMQRNCSGNILAVAFFPDGKRIVTAGHDHQTAKVWNLETMAEDGSPFKLGHKSRTRTLAVSVSKDGAYVVTGGEDGRVCLWRENDRTMPPRILGSSSPFHITSVTFNGTMHPLRVASGGSEGVVCVWNVKDDMENTPTTRIVIRPEGPRTTITSVQFSPSNPAQLAVTSNSAKIISVYNAVNGQKIFDLTGHTTAISSFSWFPGGQHIVSTGDSIRIWDVRQRAQSGDPLVGHGNFVRSVAVSPDGKYIASGSNDGTVRVWNAATREQIGTPITVTRIRLVRFSLDSKSLLTVSRDERVGMQRWTMEHLEVEEGLKLTKEIVDGFIADSNRFQDNLYENLQYEFKSLHDTHAEQVKSISNLIEEKASESQVELQALDSLTRTLDDNLSGLASEHKLDIEDLKKDLTKISEDNEASFKELKESVDSKHEEMQRSIRTINDDIQKLSTQLKDLTQNLMKAMSQRSMGPGLPKQ